MLLKKKKKKQEIKGTSSNKTICDFMPITDIDYEGIVYKKNDKVVGYLKITPISINLLSARERVRKIKLLTEALNGESEKLFFYCIGRPVDLNEYINDLQTKLKNENNYEKKNLLSNYIREASEIVSSGEVTERLFYLGVESDNKAELIKKLKHLNTRLMDAELESTICDYDSVLELYSLYIEPNTQYDTGIQSNMPIFKEEE